MGKTLFTKTTLFRVDTEYDGEGYQEVTVPLNDERLSLTQIADLMNFTSLSYFSRYCTKHLGQSPSDYRMSLQPK